MPNLKIFSLILLAFVIDAGFGDYIFDIRPCPTPLPPPASNWSSLATAKPFIVVSGSGLARQQTEVHACYTNDSLHVKFDCIDEKIHSTFTKCNEPLYQQDTVEMFLTNPYAVDLHYYLELELSPHGVLFASIIYNPDLVCAGIVGKPIDCDSSGIVYTAQILQDKNRWWGYLQVPFKLLKSVGNITYGTPNLPPKFTDWKGNFYRIDIPPGSTQTKEYSCWSPTMADPPCFHKPKFFGTIRTV